MNRLVETLTYEGKPFVCAAFGLYAMSLTSAGPTVKIGGLVLVCCAAVILYMRARYRGFVR